MRESDLIRKGTRCLARSITKLVNIDLPQLSPEPNGVSGIRAARRHRGCEGFLAAVLGSGSIFLACSGSQPSPDGSHFSLLRGNIPLPGMTGRLHRQKKCYAGLGSSAWRRKRNLFLTCLTETRARWALFGSLVSPSDIQYSGGFVIPLQRTSRTPGKLLAKGNFLEIRHNTWELCTILTHACV